jgi:hypothetical protein
MYRSRVSCFIMIYLFMSVFCVLAAVFAADGFMENVLPARECAAAWIMKDKAALFTKETLSDHINGEAELYFPYGFDLAATATYVNSKDPEVWMAADVYRMASLLDAFGIYSNYRKADAAGAMVGAEGFHSASQLMFYQGRYFVRIQVTGTTELREDTLLTCGRAISRNLPFNAAYPRELEAFRIPAVVPKSERYIAQSVLGYDFFRRGITAAATVQGERVQVLVIPEDSQDGARKAFDRYCAYLKAEGKDLRLTEKPEKKFVKAFDPLYGGVYLVQSDRYIIGAVRMKDPAAAEQLIEQLQERIAKEKGIF